MSEDSELRRLRERVAGLEATLAVFRLEARYARSWDTGDGDAWAGLFTEEGAFEIAAVGDRPASQVAGREELAAYCRSFNGHTAGIHLMHLPEVTVDGDRARAGIYFEFRFLRTLQPPETISGTTAGYYEVRYRLTPAGWRIEHRLEKPIVRDNRILYSV
jgi:SnoaL-like domain